MQHLNTSATKPSSEGPPWYLRASFLLGRMSRSTLRLDKNMNWPMCSRSSKSTHRLRGNPQAAKINSFSFFYLPFSRIVEYHGHICVNSCSPLSAAEKASTTSSLAQRTGRGTLRPSAFFLAKSWPTQLLQGKWLLMGVESRPQALPPSR